MLPRTNKGLLVLLTARFWPDQRCEHNSLCRRWQRDTWQSIEFAAANAIHGIRLSRSRSHQNALLAGLFSVEGDALVSVDAVLKDDITVIDEMIRHSRAGAAHVTSSRP